MKMKLNINASIEMCFKCFVTSPSQDQNALEKLYGPLKQRYQDRYGNFVKITRIPNPPNSTFPNMAYVELVDNSLPSLPKLPVVKNGKWVVYGKEEENEQTALVQSQ